MANSVMQLVSDGSLSTIPLTIKFFEQAHIKVSVDGVLLPAHGYSYVWSGANTITISPAVALGLKVDIRRQTPSDYVLHDFQAGAVFSETSIDDNFRQDLFLLQEAREQSVVTDLFADLDMHGNKVRNLGDAVLGRDAVPLAQVQQLVYTAGGNPYVDAHLLALTKRSFAEAGYNVVGTFQDGFTITTSSDIGIDKVSGIGYTGPISPVLAGTNPTAGGFVSVSGDLHRTALPIVSPTEKRFAGGADPTGVADSTDALEACIAYCSPFEWQGSVAATKAYMGQVRAALGGFGKFRITRPLKVNPFLVIATERVGGFFGQNGGFQIIADFDDKDGFALDTAPYNSSGVRELGKLASRNDWDSGAYTGCPGFSMFGIDVVVKDGRNLRGTLNRCMAQQSHIERCSLLGGNIGVQNSTCWGGSLHKNHISARAIPIFNGNDVTVDDQQVNYLSVIGAKPTSAQFNWPAYPDSALIGKTCCVFNSYGHPTHKNNIWEGGQIGAMCTNAASMHLDDNYVEGASFEYVLAAHTVSVKLSVSWLIAANAKLLHVRGATVEVDVGHATYFNVSQQALADHDAYSKVILKGLRTGAAGAWLMQTKFCDVADYSDGIVNGVREIFVSNTGDDTNSGLHVDRPVNSLQEVMSRLHPTAINLVRVNGACPTKYTYRNGENVSGSSIAAERVVFVAASGTPQFNVSESFGQIHCIPPRVRNVEFSGVAINLAAASGVYDRAVFIPADGRKDVRLDYCNVYNGTGAYLIGPLRGKAGITSLEANNSSIACALQTDYGDGSSAFAWMDVAANTSVAGGSVGYGSGKKIVSMLYP